MIIPISQMGKPRRCWMLQIFSLSYFFSIQLQAVDFLVFKELVSFKIYLNILKNPLSEIFVFKKVLFDFLPRKKINIIPVQK